MGKFVAMLRDKQKGTLTQGLLEEHVNHLHTLHEAGVLQLCGPLLQSGMALQILSADSLEQAKSWVEKDPMIREGYYASYELYELQEPNEGNSYLLSDTARKLS